MLNRVCRSHAEACLRSVMIVPEVLTIGCMSLVSQSPFRQGLFSIAAQRLSHTERVGNVHLVCERSLPDPGEPPVKPCPWVRGPLPCVTWGASVSATKHDLVEQHSRTASHAPLLLACRTLWAGRANSLMWYLMCLCLPGTLSIQTRVCAFFPPVLSYPHTRVYPRATVQGLSSTVVKSIDAGVRQT